MGTGRAGRLGTQSAEAAAARGVLSVQNSAKSKACREEVAEVPDGRLWAFVDGYIISVVRRAPQRPPRFACPGVPRALRPS